MKPVSAPHLSVLGFNLVIIKLLPGLLRVLPSCLAEDLGGTDYIVLSSVLILFSYPLANVFFFFFSPQMATVSWNSWQPSSKLLT